MKELSWGPSLQNARWHMERLYGRTSFTRAEQKELMDEIFQELLAAREELEAARDALSDQSELLASENRRYEESFHEAPDAHLVTDQFGTIEQANHAASILLQYPIAQLKRTPLRVFLRPDSWRAFLDQLPHLPEQAPHYELEYWVQPHAGSAFRAALTVSTANDPDTGQVRLHWQIRDVSEHWQAEKRMRDLARLAIWAQEQDRQRVSSFLYSDIAQVLAALHMHLGAVSTTLPSELAPLHAGLDLISAQLKETIVRVAMLAGGLYPPELSLLGLETTLRDYCEEFARQKHLSVEFQGVPVEGLPDSKRILLFRLLQAALDEAVRQDHPQRIRVTLVAEEAHMRLSVEDDAAGKEGHFHDSPALADETAARRGASEGGGLVELSDRLELLGGTCEMRAHPGAGLRVTAKVPYAQ